MLISNCGVTQWRRAFLSAIIPASVPVTGPLSSELLEDNLSARTYTRQKGTILKDIVLFRILGFVDSARVRLPSILLLPGSLDSSCRHRAPSQFVFSTGPARASLFSKKKKNSFRRLHFAQQRHFRAKNASIGKSKTLRRWALISRTGLWLHPRSRLVVSQAWPSPVVHRFPVCNLSLGASIHAEVKQLPGCRLINEGKAQPRPFPAARLLSSHRTPQTSWHCVILAVCAANSLSGSLHRLGFRGH
ncbi:hypothetical protein QBC43DRAFT_104753 [Cladorrhinum sp. PSN259]|nr:hypothetical protein QBC43DRAFT_104753 [Cladorrhinum sp. PSN259]